MNLANAINANNVPDDANLVGIVVSLLPLQVNYRGGIVLNPGVMGSYVPAPGDTVTMIRQNSSWLIIGANATGNASSNTSANINSAASVATTTSAGFVNVAGANILFSKRLTSTKLRVDASLSLFTSLANTGFSFGFDVLRPDNSLVIRANFVSGLLNVASDHKFVSAQDYYTIVPAGDFNLQLLWRRDSGLGTLTRDTNDWNSIMVSEMS